MALDHLSCMLPAFSAAADSQRRGGVAKAEPSSAYQPPASEARRFTSSLPL